MSTTHDSTAVSAHATDAPVVAPKSKGGKKAGGAPKKPRAPKVAKGDAPSANPPAGGDAVAKKPRRTRFNPYLPSSFLNLSEVWNYRMSQRRGLDKMRNRVAASKDEEEKRKLQMNVRRYELALNQLDENSKEVHDNLKLLLDLTKSGVKVDKPVADFLHDTSSSLAHALNVQQVVEDHADE
jgi:hypothetical protein